MILHECLRQNLRNVPRSLWHRQPCLNNPRANNRPPLLKSPTWTYSSKTNQLWNSHTSWKSARNTFDQKRETDYLKIKIGPSIATPRWNQSTGNGQAQTQKRAPAPDRLAPPNQSRAGHIHPTTYPKQGLSLFNKSSRHPEAELNASTTLARFLSERDSMKSFSSKIKTNLRQLGHNW